MHHIIFLHGGALAAPMNPSLYGDNGTTSIDLETTTGVGDEFPEENITFVKETLVTIQPPHQSIDLAELYMQKAPSSFNNFIESGGYFLESVMQFFKGVLSAPPPVTADPENSNSGPGTRGLRKLDYV